jgi:hypothetical protein
MAKLKSTTLAPGAWVVNSNDKGRKSIKKGKVYLQDKEEFIIELYNPLQQAVLADIKLNGSSISKSGLVLNPGQRFYLDCFIDDRKKFTFNTYEVEDNDETQNAIAKNGLLEVFFYKESVVSLDGWSNKFNRIIVEKYYPTWYPWYYYGGTTAIGGSLANTTIATNSTNLNTSNSITGNTYYSSDVSFNASNGTIATSYSSNNIETGRIEKGEKSKQKFEKVDMDFDNYYIASTIIQLLPESRKPVETKELKKERRIPSGLWPHQENYKNKSEDVIELIKKLAELHTAGILTDDEFTNKKAELLSKI